MRFTNREDGHVLFVEGKVLHNDSKSIVISLNDHTEMYTIDKWSWEENDKLWYVYVQSAEEDSASVVELSLDEWRVVNKVCSLTPFTGGGYCGSSFIGCRGYTTKVEAIQAYHDGTFNEDV